MPQNKDIRAYFLQACILDLHNQIKKVMSTIVPLTYIITTVDIQSQNQAIYKTSHDITFH